MPSNTKHSANGVAGGKGAGVAANTFCSLQLTRTVTGTAASLETSNEAEPLQIVEAAASLLVALSVMT